MGSLLTWGNNNFIEDNAVTVTKAKGVMRGNLIAFGEASTLCHKT